MTAPSDPRRLGWIGTGRMGYRLAERLLRAGHDVSVYNRTRAKAEPLADLGATVVDSPRQLGDRDIVFTMVAGPQDVIEVVGGEQGILSGSSTPNVIVDSTTIDREASRRLVAMAARRGTTVLAAPVSGNPKVVSFRPSHRRRFGAQGRLQGGSALPRGLRPQGHLGRRRR